MFSNLTNKITEFLNSLATALDNCVKSVKDSYNKLRGSL